MSHHISYDTISWEQYEDVCLALWFDEGCTNIKPMGRQREGGRDAIFVDDTTGELTIFQFKCWATKYETSALKLMIRKAAEKIASFKPQRFILNSAHEPNPVVNDWISTLAEELDFDVEYWDRSWTDLRLDNHRQDLRRDYFGLDLAHHTWKSLTITSEGQIARTISGLSNKYNAEIHLKREVESKFVDFEKSDRIGLALVDQAGRGKTSVLCNIAQELVKRGRVAVLIRGDSTLVDDSSLEQIVIDALGYDKSDYQAHLRDVALLLKQRKDTCYVLLDGISETDDLAKASRSLRNILTRFGELGCFKLCFSCRDSAWVQLSYDIPKDLLFLSDPDQKRHELLVHDFSDNELSQVLPLYRKAYQIEFQLSRTASNQLQHPLLLRLFCEAHAHQTLGRIGAIPIAQTFGLYLDSKALLISNHSKGGYRKTVIVKLLRDIVGIMWQLEDTTALSEEHWDATFQMMTLHEREKLIQLLEEEGIVYLTEERFSLRRSIRFVFTELREYLLLQHLLLKVPDGIRDSGDVIKTAILIIKQRNTNLFELDTHKLCSLLGLLLSDVAKRRQFLRLLLEMDFYTFCVCLTSIPPTGILNRCNEQSLHALGEQLHDWYLIIKDKALIKGILTSVQRWQQQDEVSFETEVIASPECREVTYRHTGVKDSDKNKDLIKVSQVSAYPTFRISLSSADEKIELHDPDQGIVVTSWQSTGSIQRTINTSFSPAFIGESLNVPERMVLYDIYQEIIQIVKDKKNRLPILPSILLDELNRSGKSRKKNLNILSNDKMSSTIIDVFNKAIFSYEYIVSNYFPLFKNMLNISAHMPCGFVFVTNRSHIKYSFIPFENASDIRILHQFIRPDLDLSNSKWHIDAYNKETGETLDLDKFVKQELMRMNKLRPPVRPIDIIEPIDIFFGNAPINTLVDKWLTMDFQLIFGFNVVEAP